MLINSSYTFRLTTAAGAVLALTLAGCATAPQTVDTEQTRPAALDETATAQERLSAEAMLQAMAGELAGAENEYTAAARHYTFAATESDDPDVAARATEIAVYAEAWSLARVAVARWRELTDGRVARPELAAQVDIRAGDYSQAKQELQRLLLAAASPKQGWGEVVSLIAPHAPAEDGLALMQALIADNPNWAPAHAHYNLSRLYQTYGQPDGALQAAARASAESSDLSYALWHARLLEEQGQSASAIQVLQPAVQDAPLADSEDARILLATLVSQADGPLAALELLEPLPDSAFVLLSRAYYAEAAGEDDRLAGYYQALLQLEDGPQRQYYLGQIAELMADYQAASEHYARIDGGPSYTRARSRLAIALAQIDRLDEALYVLRQLQNADEETASGAFALAAELQIDNRRLEAAEATFDRGLSLMPDSLTLRYGRALLFERQDRLDEAIAELRALVADYPEDSSMLNALGYTLADRTDQYDEARVLIEQAYALRPDDPAIIDSLGWIAFKQGDLETAQALLEEALSKAEDGEIAAHLAEVLWARGQREDALDLLRDSLAQFPDQRALLDLQQRIDP